MASGRGGRARRGTPSNPRWARRSIRWANSGAGAGAAARSSSASACSSRATESSWSATPPLRARSTAARSPSIVAVSSGGVIAGLSQLRQRSVQSGAGGGLAEVEDRGDLGVREAGGELQGEQVALVAVERGHRGADRLALEGE